MVKTAVVIGAGIAGACCAGYLQKRGIDVTLVDRTGIGEETSFGNAGSLNPDGILPVAMPGMIKQVPKWLLDSKGPLALRWSYLPFSAAWLTRFLMCANREQMQRSAQGMKLLASRVFECYSELLPPDRYRELIQHRGCLYVYETAEARVGEKTSVALRRSFGAVLEEVDGSEIRQMEPGLSAQFAYGFFAPNAALTVDPRRLTQAVADEALTAGANFVKVDVTGIGRSRNGQKIVRGRGGVELAADAIVVAGGAWSNRIAATIGDHFPLESQRGYHVTFVNPGVVANRMISWGGRRTFATPMEVGLRVAGTVEIAGLKAAPNWERADILLAAARAMYPGLNLENTSRWMGHRPCLPDSLPVIGESRRMSGVFYAFGHQHLGMMSSAATGRVVSQLVAGESPEFDLGAFRPDRF